MFTTLLGDVVGGTVSRHQAVHCPSCIRASGLWIW